jgi:hypothetical protein
MINVNQQQEGCCERQSAVAQEQHIKNAMHARIWSWRVWYLRSCNTGEVKSLQPMPVPGGV